MEFHPDLDMRMDHFKMEVVGTFPRPIIRQSMEGVSIARAVKARDSGAPIHLLNSKSELYQPGVVRFSFVPVLQKE